MLATQLSTLDRRPYFEKALQYGLAQGILTSERFEIILADGAKGIVQIANFFGTAYLRQELETARDRLVTLLSLYLEAVSGGDLHAAAVSLREKSHRSHTKGGSDMLRALIDLPGDTLLERGRRKSPETQKPELNVWTYAEPLDFHAYTAKLREGRARQVEVEYAIWLLAAFGQGELDEPATQADAASVVSSAMLVLYVKGAPLRMPSRLDFVKLVVALQYAEAGAPRVRKFLAAVPEPFGELARASYARFVEQTLPRIRGCSADSLLHGGGSGIFFIRDDLGEDSRAYEKRVAGVWYRATSGQVDDDHVIATVLLLVATGFPPKARLLKREAREIIAVFRTKGFDSQAVLAYIETYAPIEHRQEFKKVWRDDLMPEADQALGDPDDSDRHMERATTYLQKTCKAEWKAKK